MAILPTGLDKKLSAIFPQHSYLMDAAKKSLNLSDQIDSFAVVVDAKNKNVVNFYKHYGFIQFETSPTKLFLPMSTIKQLWNK